jgi:4-amino-4-deoxy-L-arabinose transferase-like glycosyltransferase
MSSRFFKVVGKLLVILGLIALFIVQGREIARLAQQGSEAVAYPYPLNYGEGPLLDQTVRILSGGGLYNLDVPPYTITNYPPLYMLAQVPFVAGFGLSLAYGRLISLVSIALAALFLGLTIRAITRNWVAAAAGGLLLLTIPYIFHWSALARIDNFALSLSLIGLFCAAQFPNNGWGIFFAALFMSAAVYTRQTYLLAAPLAAFVYLWANAGFIQAIKFALWLGCIVLGVFAVLLAWTGGGIWFHLITANVNALDTGILGYYASEIVSSLVILLGMALIVLLFGWIRPEPRRAWWMAAPYLLGGFVVALTISKVGSDVNYLFELIAALCLAAGVFIALVKAAPLVQMLALLLLAGQVVVMSRLTETQYAPLIAGRIANRAEADMLYDAIVNETRPILADEAMGMLVLAGKPILFQPFEMSQLALTGMWDQAAFLERMDGDAYPVILMYNPVANPRLRFERWTPEMLAIINDRYRAAAQRAETFVYWLDAGE